jgi:DNA-binding transcriptional regulator YhcF (GntR family)
MLKLSKTRFYLVPVVMRAVDIFEFLSGSQVPVKTREISVATGIPPTTTYRILRTLVHRGYVSQDFEGRFSIPSSAAKSTFLTRTSSSQSLENMNSPKTNLSGEEVIEIIHSVLHCLRIGNDRNIAQGSSEGASEGRDGTNWI